MAEKDQRINPGYANFQLAKALVTSEEHADAQTRENARQKILKWYSVIEGMLTGRLEIGSRTPAHGVPPWATLEVVTGGFATGNLAANGELQPHEAALRARLGLPESGMNRLDLNRFYLTEEGQRELRTLLESARFDVQVPEEAALLVIAWLAANGEVEVARQLLVEIAEFFDRLRFYPVSTERPAPDGARVFVASVGQVMSSLDAMRVNPQIVAQKNAAQVWAPIYDEVVQLFLETVAGDTPNLVADSRKVEGGWPCVSYPAGWYERAVAVLRAYDAALATAPCRRAKRSKGHFAQLIRYLKQIVVTSQSLPRGDLGRIRRMLAGHVHKHGIPGSGRRRAAIAEQLRQASPPTFRDLANVMIDRLRPLPRHEGLDEPQSLQHPASEGEELQHRVSRGSAMPPPVLRRVERARWDRLEVLVQRGLLPSGDVLAGLLPQITSSLRAMGFKDASLARVYAAVYRAFRRRRSLLLLDLQKQVQIEELPWVRAIERFRGRGASNEASAQTLREVAGICLKHFPQAVLPNKLIQELVALAKDAKLELPLTEELAADIFMGKFSGKFQAAAKVAATLLKGTLYERYYGIDYGAIEKWPDVPLSPLRTETAVQLEELCKARAGVPHGTVVQNGMILEQAQIITTHNLAVLFARAGLGGELHGELATMAQRCFEWTCRRLQIKADRHARLIHIKNSAYAWRQMVFFLSLAGAGERKKFLQWGDEHLRKQTGEFQEKFAPAWRGLLAAAESKQPGPTQCFTGWSKAHWLMA
jgi:hypothetical protein